MKKLIVGFATLLISFNVCSVQASDIHARLNGFIDERNIPRLKSALRKATPDDTVIITINSMGGVMEVGDEIRDAIKKTKGKVVANIKGSAYSEAAFIAIACHEIKGKGKVMFHVGFSVDENGETAVPSMLLRKSLATVKPILTSDEYQRMAKGKDIYMSVDTLRQRTCQAWNKGCFS